MPKQNKLKILFAGASGYGNIGDDSYKTVFEAYLGKDYDLYFDSPYPDLSLIPQCDHVVIGGGGLIYNNNTPHFMYMTSYLNRAIKYGKPFSFISCGVQIVNALARLDLDTIKTKGVKQIQVWKKYLEKAEIVTVRSQMDVDIIKEVAPKAKCVYIPDLAYLMGNICSKNKLIKEGSVVVIPTKSGEKNPEFSKLWAKYKNFKPYIVAFAADDYDIVDRLGNEICTHQNVVTRKHLKPEEACGLLKNADRVITGRYHGAVLSRAVGIPEEKIHVIDQRYKSRVEQPPKNLQEAERHLDYLKAVIAGNSIEESTDGTLWLIRPDSKVGGLTQDRLGLNDREPYNFQALRKYCDKNKTFLDVGANVGGFAVRMAKFYKKVIAFEPCVFNYQGLKDNISLNAVSHKVLPMNVAVGGEPGVVEIEGIGGGAKVQLRDGGISTTTVPLITLDSLTVRSDVQLLEVGVIKIDVEGYELEVLRGAENLIDTDSPTILVETHQYDREGNEINPNLISNVKKFLLERGYTCEVLHECTNGDKHLLFISSNNKNNE